VKQLIADTQQALLDGPYSECIDGSAFPLQWDKQNVIPFLKNIQEQLRVASGYATIEAAKVLKYHDDYLEPFIVRWENL